MEQRSHLCFVWLILLFDLTRRVAGNAEGDALTQLRNSLSSSDPNNVLQSWDATLVTPCTWFHVTCNSENKVTRVDLGSANLSGKLVPVLESCIAITLLGGIPEELGDLKDLVSLDLYANNISGPIPPSLGKLEKLRFLRLNNNSLSGEIPRSLTAVQLQVLDISYNQLTGEIPVTGSFSLFTPISYKHNRLTQLPSPPPPPASPPPPSSGKPMTAAIAGGVAAGAALLFAVPAIAIAWWLKRKP